MLLKTPSMRLRLTAAISQNLDSLPTTILPFVKSTRQDQQQPRQQQQHQQQQQQQQLLQQLPRLQPQPHIGLQGEKQRMDRSVKRMIESHKFHLKHYFAVLNHYY